MDRQITAAVGELEHVDRGGERDGRPGVTPVHVLSYTLAVLVHGFSVVLLAGGVWLLVQGWPNPFLIFFGVLLVGLFLVLRPRFPQLDQSLPQLTRGETPRLYSLVDSVAAAIGTRSVDTIVIDADVNASVVSYGLRGRALTIGLGLWSVLTPQQQVALLGHELGHFANGDTRHGHVVGSALHTLRVWVVVPRPERWDGRLTQLLAVALMRIPYYAALGALKLLEKVSLRGGPHREYLADELAARIASTEAARQLMETLLFTDRIEVELRRLSNEARAFAGRPDAPRMDETLWPRLADHLASAPAHDRERRRAESELAGHRQDDTHPPTHLRIERLSLRDPCEPRVVLDEENAAAIREELRPAAKRLARRVAQAG